MSIKLDMSKVYDQVEWKYLEQVMVLMGLQPSMIFLIMSCVSTSLFSVLINVVPKDRIIPTQGLRQGDPLSPCLFLLCMEGLVSLLKCHRTRVQSLKICRGALSVNHLLFANDSIILCKADLDTNKEIQRGAGNACESLGT